MKTTILAGAALALTGAAAAQPANDACSGAQAITGYQSFAFDNASATTDGPASGLCAPTGKGQIERDVWFCWTAPWGGLAMLTTCGQTGVDTRVAVYDGCTCPEGTAVLACDDNGCSTQSRLTWFAQFGQKYLIRVGVAPSAAGGSGTFTIGSGILHGPVYNPGNGNGYWILEPSSWSHARNAAVAMEGDLAAIETPQENEWVRSELANFGGQERHVWIGLNDAAVEGQFAWSSGQPLGYSNWGPGQPGNPGPSEDYVELSGSTGAWTDTTDLPSGVPVHAAVEMVAQCYPDCDLSQQLTIADFGCFQTRFTAADPYADCNGVGGLTIADFGCFLTRFVAGC